MQHKRKGLKRTELLRQGCKLAAEVGSREVKNIFEDGEASWTGRETSTVATSDLRYGYYEQSER